MQPAAKDLCWAPLRRDESSARRVDRGQTDRSCHRHSCVPVSPTPTRLSACAAALPLGHIRFVSPYFCRGTEQGSSPCHMWFVCARHTWNSTFQTGIIANVLTTWQLPTPLRKQALAEPPLSGLTKTTQSKDAPLGGHIPEPTSQPLGEALLAAANLISYKVRAAALFYLSALKKNMA